MNGYCKSFDDSADGYVRSEAVVAIILEKAQEAKRIYSEIVYTKTNCDGYKEEGITFPSSEMQKILLKDFYAECRIDPITLTYVEAHGTGISLQESKYNIGIIIVFRNKSWRFPRA